MNVIQPKFSALLPTTDDKPEGKYAAVSLLVNYTREGPFLVVTKRSNLVRSHKGQISLAGGKGESFDVNAMATALRETEEELGISSDKLKILGQLKNVTSIDGLNVIPFVMTCKDLQIDFDKIDTHEVAAVYQIPFEEFVLGKEQHFEFVAFGQTRNTVFYDTSVVRVWGLTAHIIYQSQPNL